MKRAEFEAGVSFKYEGNWYKFEPDSESSLTGHIAQLQTGSWEYHANVDRISVLGFSFFTYVLNARAGAFLRFDTIKEVKK